MIFDTDAIISAQRGNQKVANIINDTEKRYASIITYMEFVQYAKDKAQYALSKSFFTMLNFEILPLSSDISHRACTYVERFSLSHGMGIPDALIAATAFEQGLTLVTANEKHYKMIEGLQLQKLVV